MGVGCSCTVRYSLPSVLSGAPGVRYASPGVPMASRFVGRGGPAPVCENDSGSLPSSSASTDVVSPSRLSVPKLSRRILQTPEPARARPCSGSAGCSSAVSSSAALSGPIFRLELLFCLFVCPVQFPGGLFNLEILFCLFVRSVQCPGGFFKPQSL